MDIASSYMGLLFMILVNEKSDSTKLITALIDGTACIQKNLNFICRQVTAKPTCLSTTKIHKIG